MCDGSWRPGVLGGAAALTKQVAAINLIALSVFLLLSHHRDIAVALKGLAWMTAGALGTLGVALVPFVLTSSTADFFYATVHYNQLYSGSLSMHDRLVFAQRNLPDSVYAAPLPMRWPASRFGTCEPAGATCSTNSLPSH